MVDTHSKSVERLDTQDCNHDVKLVGRHLFVAGDFYGLQTKIGHGHGHGHGCNGELCS